MKSRFDRRTFLAGLGASTALIPLLDSELVVGQELSPPKRLLVISWSNGYDTMSQWLPGAGFSLPTISSPLEPFKNKLLFVNGLGQRVHYEADGQALGWNGDVLEYKWWGGHDANPAVLTGVPLSEYAPFHEISGGDSIDQFIAMELAKTVALPFESLVIGPYGTGGYNGTISYKGKSSGITPETNPFNLYSQLFAGRDLPQGEFDRLRATRRSVMDYLDGSLTKFSTRMGASDRAKIESHLEAVRRIETQLGSTGTLDCEAPVLGAEFDTSTNIDNYPATLRAFCDLVTASFRCDLTRVASMNFTDAGGDNMVFSWLGEEFTGPGDEYELRQYHDITHKAGQSDAHRARKFRVEQWFFEQVAYIADQLEKTPEGTGTMLDNTLIVVTNTMSTNHESKTVPFTLVGNLNKYFKEGGSVVSFPESNGMGTAHNRLLVTIANAMGVDGSNFGVSHYNQPLTELSA